MLVVEIEAGYREVRFRLKRLFLDRRHVSVSVEADHAVTFGVGNVICEYCRARGPIDRVGEQDRQAMPVENIVAENKRGRTALHESRADDEGLCQTLRLGLNGI